MKTIFIMFALVLSASIFGVDFEAEAKKVLQKYYESTFSTPLKVADVEFKKDTQTLTVIFSGKQKIGIDEARGLYLDIFEKFSKELAYNDELKTLLQGEMIKKVEVELTFENKWGKLYGDDKVAFVFNVNGKLFYTTYDKASDEFVDLHSENIETAKLVGKQELIVAHEAVKK